MEVGYGKVAEKVKDFYYDAENGDILLKEV